MTEEEKQHNTECGHDKHNEHLCFLQFEGYHYDHKAEYKELVSEAGFLCRNCGRTAKSAANVCDPVEL